MAKLILRHDGVVIRDFPLQGKTVNIGRHADNDIQLDDSAVSGRHARIRQVPNDYLDGHNDVYLEDLGSTNGTQVNGLPISKYLLKNGDQVQIGQHRFEYVSEQDHHYEQTAIYLPET